MKKYYLKLVLKSKTSEFKNFNELIHEINDAIIMYNKRFKGKRFLYLKSAKETLELYFEVDPTLDVTTRHISWFSSYLYKGKGWDKYSNDKNSLFRVETFSELAQDFEIDTETKDDHIKEELLNQQIPNIDDDTSMMEEIKPQELDKRDTIIKINISKIEIMLNTLKNESLNISDWKSPLAISITLLITLLTTEFKGIYFSGDIYKGIAATSLIFCLVSTVKYYKKSMQIDLDQKINEYLNDLKS
ncbi:hypothetical protein RH915_05930 [Serpentinicella sp. ANB-PHB4]|uniref:hypothetical protein n=1 Tax=Serpentinicella sp. ANB-PHB4 TaxID=3074076 RepID=UPI00285F8C14|nr:hypothetical protein [Serpentinicella sp. ANB-PHB4]MDR5659022.1 hypothetical protein [Serpentinicella sp. ANB-PHB4]